MATPGFEILFCSVRNQLFSPQDALMTLLHWQLVSDGFKCVGSGEQTGKNEKPSELLPTGWNQDQEIYILRYTKNSRMFMLKVIVVGTELLVHAMDMSNQEKVVNLNLRTEDFTTGDLSSYDGAFRNLEKVCSDFKKEILAELSKKGNVTKLSDNQESSRSRTQESSRSNLRDEDPLRVHPRRPPQHHPPDWMSPDDPFSVGRSDLDPLGRGGGGMVFDPLRINRPGRGPDPNAGLPGRLPPGAVPPGARFDPFGPPGQRPGPDPDHLPPPGYDDMFM